MKAEHIEESRLANKQKSRAIQKKLNPYEVNMDNFLQNQQPSMEKIDPRGILATAIYASFSGVVQDAEIFEHSVGTLQASYELYVGDEWRYDNQESNEREGCSNFCELKNGKIVFGLSFDCTVSTKYVLTWPQILLKFKGFNKMGELVTKGYAQVDLPKQGKNIREAYIYSIVSDQRWYHKLIPFMETDCVDLNRKEMFEIIGKGESRENSKIKTIGLVKFHAQVITRNMSRHGYK